MTVETWWSDVWQSYRATNFRNSWWSLRSCFVLFYFIFIIFIFIFIFIFNFLHFSCFLYTYWREFNLTAIEVVKREIRTEEWEIHIVNRLINEEQGVYHFLKDCFNQNLNRGVTIIAEVIIIVTVISDTSDFCWYYYQ